jgi:microcystin-dependent protein
LKQAGWLTPDVLPGTLRSCVVQFPDSESFASLVRGALYLLSEEKNYEAFGALTPQETADAMRQMLFSFLEEDCVIVPVGAILEFAGSVIPTGYLWCHGGAVSRTLYGDLYDVIGVEFGVGDGITTFNLPDRRGKVGVGLDPTDGDFDLLGATGGAKTHTLTTGQVPSHSHTVFADNSMGAGATARRVIGVTGASNVSTGSTGGGGSHNNVQPYVVVNHIIKF